MDVDLRQSEDAMVVVLGGRVDSETAPTLGEALSEALEHSAKLIIDMEGVQYINSAGLRELVGAFKEARAKDGDVRLAALTPRVAEVFEVSGLASIFQMHSQTADAVASFRA